MSEWNGNAEAFRTYFHGKLDENGDSVPKEKVKGMPGHPWNEVCNDRDIGTVLNDGFVDISFDSPELSDSFWNMAAENNWDCLIFENLMNGHIHSIWRKPTKWEFKDGKDKKLAVGLIADIHSGSTYIRLRVDGVDRFPPSFEPKRIQEVPEELFSVNTNMNLWGMAKGEGRNNDLYRYILVLQSQLQLNDDTICRILGNTNNFIFADRLNDEELEVILRDEAFQKPVFFNDKTFLFNEFANYIRQSEHIIKINGQLHIYREGIYIHDMNIISGVMRSYMPNIKRNQKAEVLDCLNDTVEEYQTADARYIAFANGIYDIVQDTMQPFSSSIVVTNKIPWDFNREAYSELADQTLNKLSCGDAAIRALLEECIGYCFYRANNYKKSFMLTGKGDNGKSTFLDCVKAILGEKNISALDLKELGDRFTTSMMFGKLANIGDDIGDDFLQGSQVSIFKKIVAGNRIKAERKGQDPFEFNPFIKLLFSANDIPHIKDKTGAVLNRLIIIPFKALFCKNDPDYDPQIGKKLLQKDSLEYFIRLGVEGLKRIIDNKGFTKSEVTEQAAHEYDLMNNPIKGFFATQEEDYIFRETVQSIYTAYQIYCDDCGGEPESKIAFGKSVVDMFGVESYSTTIAGKRIRKYRKP